MIPELFLSFLFIVSISNSLKRLHIYCSKIPPSYLLWIHLNIAYVSLSITILLFSFFWPIVEECIFRYFLVWALCHYSYYQYIISFLFALCHLSDYYTYKFYYSLSQLSPILSFQMILTFFMSLCLLGTLQPDPETCLITPMELSYNIFLHGTFNYLGSIYIFIFHHDKFINSNNKDNQRSHSDIDSDDPS